ncbi:unnamed protein product [Amoebophrya sp. A120]|nr:unnamed protein product [Amoebophrya sp. A120]|eukprot:GSA120T00022232001.1
MVYFVKTLLVTFIRRILFLLFTLALPRCGYRAQETSDKSEDGRTGRGDERGGGGGGGGGAATSTTTVPRITDEINDATRSSVPDEVEDDPNFKVIFLHIPKTGGLSIEKTLRAIHKLATYGTDATIQGHRQAIGGHLLNVQLKRKIGRLLQKGTGRDENHKTSSTTTAQFDIISQELHHQTALKESDFPDLPSDVLANSASWPVLTITRNPYDRLWSIYNFPFTLEHENAPFWRPPQQTFEQFVLNFQKDYQDLQVGGTAPLGNLIEFLIKDKFVVEYTYTGTIYNRTEKVTHSAVDPSLLNRGVIDKKTHLLPTDYLRFENLEADFDHFCKKYNILNALALRLVNTNPVLHTTSSPPSSAAVVNMGGGGGVTSTSSTTGEQQADHSGVVVGTSPSGSTTPASSSVETEAGQSGGKMLTDGATITAEQINSELEFTRQQLLLQRDAEIEKLKRKMERKLHEVNTRYTFRMRRFMETVFAEEMRLFDYSYEGFLARERSRQEMKFRLKKNIVEWKYRNILDRLEEKSFSVEKMNTVVHDNIPPPVLSSPNATEEAIAYAEVVHNKHFQTASSYAMHGIDTVDIETKAGYGQWLRQSRIQNLTKVSLPARSWMTADLLVHPRLARYRTTSQDEEGAAAAGGSSSSFTTHHTSRNAIERVHAGEDSRVWRRRHSEERQDEEMWLKGGSSANGGKGSSS